MKIGYARVSTKGQNIEMQIEALQKAGCEEIFQEVVSGADTERKELNKMLHILRAGDVVVVWKLDRIGRSLKYLVEMVETFNHSEVGFASLNDPIDTTTAQGMLVFRIFASLAEFERDIIRERTLAGMANARKKGKKIGRPKGMSTKNSGLVDQVVKLYNHGYNSTEIADMLSLSRTSVWRYAKSRGITFRNNQ